MLDFGIPFGSEPGRRRPVVIIQADKENLDNLNTKVIVPLTSNTIIIFCIIFMSEKGACFNKNTPIPITNQEKNHLIKIFDDYHEKIKH